jgi:hypothetical protein
MTSAGAAPNDTISDRLSYWAPNSLCVLVMRAIRPSRPSRTIAMKMAHAECSNFWFIAMMIA